MSFEINHILNSFSELNKQYGQIPFEEWKVKSEVLSEQVWLIFSNSEDFEQNHELISLIASSLVFWNESQKYQTISKLWVKLITVKSIEIQNKLGSILSVLANGLSKEHVQSHLIGIENVDKSQKYGTEMVRFIRQYTK